MLQKFERGEMQAERLAERILSDQHVGRLLPDLIRSLPKGELNRLALVVLPLRIEDSLTSVSPQSDYYGATVSRYRRCYRTVFSNMSEAARRKATKGIADTVREADEATAILYEDVFLETGDTKLVRDNDRNIILQHLYGRLDSGPTEPLLEALTGVGKYLESGAIAVLGKSLVGDVARGRTATAQASRRMLVRESRGMPARLRTRFVNATEGVRSIAARRGTNRTC